MKLADFLGRSEQTLEAFAMRIDSTATTVSRLCRGKQSPSADMARRIYEATGGQVTPNDFHDFVTLADSDPSERGEAA